MFPVFLVNFLLVIFFKLGKNERNLKFSPALHNFSKIIRNES